MRALVLVLMLSLLAACAPGNGILSVNVRDGDSAQLHEIYAVMRANGYLMKKPQSQETHAEERWDSSGSSTTGAFMDPAFKRLVVVVMLIGSDGKLWVFFDEEPTGFSAEGQARTDRAVAALKQRFGDRITITERRNYTGTH